MKEKIKYREVKWKYVLTGTYLYALGVQTEIETRFISLHRGVLEIKQWYAWDGASGPAIDTKTILRGSLVHDALYQLMWEGLLPQSYRKKADKILYRICREDGMSLWRAQYVYRAVRWFGKGNAKGE